MAEKKYLDQAGLTYLWGKIKGLIPTKVSELTNDSGFINSDAITNKLDNNGNGSNVTAAFTASASRTNISTGESLATMFGKIAKWFTDFHTVAFSGSYNDLTNKPTIPDISGKADSATTLVGYGITDAKIAGGVITLGANSITPLTSSSSLSAAKLSGAIPSAVTGTTQAAGDSSTKLATTKFVADAVAAGIGTITGLSFEIVTSLPATGTAGTIYLISNGGANPNAYDEYVWIATNSKFEKIGTTDVDLTDYQKASELKAITNTEIDTIIAA